MAGYVINEGVVQGRTTEGDTASVRLAIDASCGCERLEQRVIRYAPGRSEERSVQERQEVLYVASGHGTLYVNGKQHALEPDTGVYLTPGDRYRVDNPGPDELLMVSVTAPQDTAVEDDHGVTVRYADQPALPASPNREFRYLVNQDMGCPDVTQFVGIIPPGRAGMHSHVYDEVVYVIEGNGVLHIGGEETPIGGGSCIHLPPRVEHCLENTGANEMRVLGVFYPQGDPASRAYEARA
ncbi:MAG TPA: cupin domain-containing protein [Gaiellaceae bacterium]|nr:cupin domain-containing protein [Gaiellaceae bacterium]